MNNDLNLYIFIFTMGKRLEIKDRFEYVKLDESNNNIFAASIYNVDESTVRYWRNQKNIYKSKDD